MHTAIFLGGGEKQRAIQRSPPLFGSVPLESGPAGPTAPPLPPKSRDRAICSRIHQRPVLPGTGPCSTGRDKRKERPHFARLGVTLRYSIPCHCNRVFAMGVLRYFDGKKPVGVFTVPIDTSFAKPSINAAISSSVFGLREEIRRRASSAQLILVDETGRQLLGRTCWPPHCFKTCSC